MDEETAIINSNTRNEKIRNFLISNKKLLVLVSVFIIFCLIGYFSLSEYNKREKVKISNMYNSVTTEHSKKNRDVTKNYLIEIINKKDSTYSPLSLYFIIDNELMSDKSKVNDLFDIIIEGISVDNEIKNLIIYKKALYNADSSNESQLLEILKPIISSQSVWKAHGLYLMAEYFYSKNEKQKAKEFFSQIMTLENANQDLKIESKKRLNRDLSE